MNSAPHSTSFIVPRDLGRMQSTFLLLVCFVCASSAWQALEPQPQYAGKTPFCVDKVEGKKKVGEEWHDLKLCVRKRCLTDSQGTPLISHSGCGAISESKNCKKVTPTEPTPYPECCPQLICGKTEKGI